MCSKRTYNSAESPKSPIESINSQLCQQRHLLLHRIKNIILMIYLQISSSIEVENNVKETISQLCVTYTKQA